MSVRTCDGRGVAAAAAALGAGLAVVAPTPSPLPYVVVGRTAESVNGAKGRPAGQAVALWVADLDLIAPVVGLDAAESARLGWLLREELLTVLVPVADLAGCPSWLRPSWRQGHALLAGPVLPALVELHQLAPLYISSGNATTGRPAVSAPEADAAFGGRLLVLDGDGAREPGRHHASSVMVRLRPGGELELVRHGVQDTSPDGVIDPTYLHGLALRAPAPESNRSLRRPSLR